MNVIVDIGCFNGRTLSLANKLLHRKRENWFGLMVEPNVYLKEDIHKSLEGTNFKYSFTLIVGSGCFKLSRPFGINICNTVSRIGIGRASASSSAVSITIQL